MDEPVVSNAVLLRLADGRFHSGQALAADIGVSRTAVWKQVQRLKTEFGLTVDAVRGRGYRIAEPLELLRADEIVAELGVSARERLQDINILTSVESTNACASAGAPSRNGFGIAWLAEHQSAGRGRRGRRWVGAFGRGLALSLAWRFDLPMSRVAALSLAAGVATAEALAATGVQGHSLKWPNDLLIDGRKLGGILVEVSGEADGPATAVVGIGLNLGMPSDVANAIDQPWVDLNECASGPVSRNQLAGRLLDRLVDACALFEREGITPFLHGWGRYDLLHGAQVDLISAQRTIGGVYRGVADDGALILETDSGCRHFHAGEVSLRGGFKR